MKGKEESRFDPWSGHKKGKKGVFYLIYNKNQTFSKK